MKTQIRVNLKGRADLGPDLIESGLSPITTLSNRTSSSQRKVTHDLLLTLIIVSWNTHHPSTIMRQVA